MNYNNIEEKRKSLKKSKTDEEIDNLLEEVYADGYDDGCCNKD